VSILAKRALLAALTVIGFLLLVFGLWCTIHLGSSGSASFTARPVAGSVVVIEPSVLNRVNDPITVSATARHGGPVWIGRATPSDAEAILRGARRTELAGVHVRDWSLVSRTIGSGTATDLSGSDVWRDTRTAQGTARVVVYQANAPEALVIATRDGHPADLTSVTITVQRRTWFFQALLVALVGVSAMAFGGTGLWQRRRLDIPSPSQDTPADPGQPVQEVSA
jgi:hypothetical protein